MRSPFPLRAGPGPIRTWAEQQPLDCGTAVLSPEGGEADPLQRHLVPLYRVALARHKTNEVSQRLATSPGVGTIKATAMVATVANAGFFKSGRHFAFWLGLVSQQNGTGSRTVLAATPSCLTSSPFLGALRFRERTRRRSGKGLGRCCRVAKPQPDSTYLRGWCRQDPARPLR